MKKKTSQPISPKCGTSNDLDNRLPKSAYSFTEWTNMIISIANPLNVYPDEYEMLICVIMISGLTAFGSLHSTERHFHFSVSFTVQKHTVPIAQEPESII